LKIPEVFDTGSIEVLVKYFYFKEINPIPLKDLFPLFHIAFFMKIEPIVTKIIDFLKENINNADKTTVICKGAFEFAYFFKEEGKKLIEPIIHDCFEFLLKKSHYQEFLKLFDERFFENNNEKIEEIFYFLLNLMKVSKVSNEIIIKFVELFKGSLLKKLMNIDANFNIKGFFRKIFQEFLVLIEINLKDVEDFMNKLNIKENHEMKEFMWGVLSQKITNLEKENLILKKELQESRENEKILNEKIKEFNEEINRNFKEFKEEINRNKIDNEMKISKNTIDNEGKMKKITIDNIERINKSTIDNEGKINKITKDNEEKIKNLQTKLENRFNFEKKILQDTFLALIEGNVKKFEEFIPIGYSFCPENNNGCYTLSNNDKTLQRTSGDNVAWRGFRCENHMNFSDKLIFSIKIEKITYNSCIMIGFCVKTAENSSGFHQTSSSFMLNLSDGNLYKRSSKSAYISNLKGKTSEIYTSILDVKLKSLEFLLNGESLGEPKGIDLKNKEILLLCPCVDLHNIGDKITIIKTH